MSNENISGDCKESINHVRFLKIFLRPKTIKNLNESYEWRPFLGKKNAEKFIELFIREGFLVPVNLDVAIDKLLASSEISEILRKNGLRLSGSKKVLADRLIRENRDAAELIAERGGLYICSEDALNFIAKHDEKIEIDINNEKNKSFEMLKNGDIKGACNVYLKTQLRYNEDENHEESIQDNASNKFEKLQYIFKSCPAVLGNITEENKIYLQSAAAMNILWGRRREQYNTEHFLPENFSLLNVSNKQAINYLIKNSEIKKEIEDNVTEYFNKFKFEFENGDLKSCDLCLSQKNIIFDIKTAPELPMIGCTSETGCMCSIETYYDEKDDNKNKDEDEDEDDKNDIENNDINEEIENLRSKKYIYQSSSLKVLKQLLDENIVTQEEYNEKRKEILSHL
jgi:hypothetical protein